MAGGYNFGKIINIQVKGYSQSSLGSEHPPVPPNLRQMYERVWDEADYVVPPAENGAFFITTNVVITPNQTLGQCPEVRWLKVESGKYVNFIIPRTPESYLSLSVKLMIL